MSGTSADPFDIAARPYYFCSYRLGSGQLADDAENRVRVHLREIRSELHDIRGELRDAKSKLDEQGRRFDEMRVFVSHALGLGSMNDLKARQPEGGSTQRAISRIGQRRGWSRWSGA